MNIWETLGIEPTTDVKLIRRRYAELVRLYHPEDQPEIYQEIVEAYQKALTYARSRNTRPENSLRKASDSQEAAELEEEANEKPNSSLNFENLTEETKTENEESKDLVLNSVIISNQLIKPAIPLTLKPLKQKRMSQSLPIILLTMMRKLG